MSNFKVVATADLWVYNAENLCVSFFYQVTSIFHLQGGGNKKKYFWAYLMGIGKDFQLMQPSFADFRLLFYASQGRSLRHN